MIQEITLDDVIGHQEAKQALLDRFKTYLNHKEVYAKFNAKPPSGILLHGASGTGKTMLIRACFNTLIKTNPEIKYKEITLGDVSSGNTTGDAQKKIYALFEKIQKSEQDWVLAFDEIDIICPDRLRTKSVCAIERTNSLLTCLDGLNGSLDNVFIIGTTNRLSQIDTAIRRSGRFDDIIEIGLPDLQDNITLAKKYLAGLMLNGDFELICDSIGEYGLGAGWAGAEYNKLRTKLVTLHIQSGYIKTTLEDICQIAGKIKGNYQRDEHGHFKEWQKIHA